MAPKSSNQSLLPFHTFIKNPTKKFKAKHRRLDNKPNSKPPGSYSIRQIKERHAKEKVEETGASEWKEWMMVKDTEHRDYVDPMQMYRVFGKAPLPEAPNGEFLSDHGQDISSRSDDQTPSIFEDISLDNNE